MHSQSDRYIWYRNGSRVLLKVQCDFERKLTNNSAFSQSLQELHNSQFLRPSMKAFMNVGDTYFTISCCPVWDTTISVEFTTT